MTAASDKPRVLLVDDDVDSCELYRVVLEGEGYAVTTAHDGHGALALLTAERFDAAILDVLLPDMNGVEVTRRARESSAAAPFFIALTGWDARRLREARAFDRVLGKPVDLGALLATLAERSSTAR